MGVYSMDFGNCDNAFRATNIFLCKRYGQSFFMKEFNNGRHRLLYNSSKTLMFYLVFKREFIQSFNSMCPNLVLSKPMFSGLGESLNYEYVKRAFNLDANILFVYPNGDVYNIHSETLVSFYNKLSKICKSEVLRLQKIENVKSKVDGSGELDFVNEETLVFPIKLLERFGYL